MKYIFCLFTLLVVYNNGISQSLFKSKEYGFEMQSPIKWNQATNTLIQENLDKFDVNEENLQKILRSNKGTF